MSPPSWFVDSMNYESAKMQKGTQNIFVYATCIRAISHWRGENDLLAGSREWIGETGYWITYFDVISWYHVRSSSLLQLLYVLVA